MVGFCCNFEFKICAFRTCFGIFFAQGYTTSKGSYGERKLQDNKMKLIRIFYENALKVTRGEGNFIFKEELVEEFEASYLPKSMFCFEFTNWARNVFSFLKLRNF